jgi:hypothetical protein
MKHAIVAVIPLAGALLAFAIIHGDVSVGPMVSAAVAQEIRIKDNVCRIAKPDVIICSNTSEHCDAFRKRQAEHMDRIFGCIDPKSKNFPCPPWSEEIDRIRHDNVEGYVCTDRVMMPDNWHDDRPK